MQIPLHPGLLRLARILCLGLATSLTGCTTLGFIGQAFGPSALPAQTFRFADGGESLYYHFDTAAQGSQDTLLFFYGGTGCPSWKYVMPRYVRALDTPARVFALNKRFVSEWQTGMLPCGAAFDAADLPAQWSHDLQAFVKAQIASASPPPRRVVLVGISEGALPAVEAASALPQVTQLILIGAGGLPMREELRILQRRGVVSRDIQALDEQVQRAPDSLVLRQWGHPHRWWREMLAWDPMPPLLSLRIPVLVGFGEADRSVAVESALALRQRFEAAGRTNLTLRLYANADHALHNGRNSCRDDFFRAASAWLDDHPATKPTDHCTLVASEPAGSGAANGNGAGPSRQFSAIGSLHAQVHAASLARHCCRHRDDLRDGPHHAQQVRAHAGLPLSAARSGSSC